MDALGPWESIMNTSLFLLSPLSRGFCYFNSVAIAAKLLQQRLNVSKILIVDWVSKCPFLSLWESRWKLFWVGFFLQGQTL